MYKYQTALFIGRFQPFHNGHLYSLKKCFEIAEKVIVGIGSSGESGTENNPWDYEIRKKMVKSVLRVLRGLSSQVVAIPDVYDDKRWGEQVVKLITKTGYEMHQVVGVGNNDWTNRILRARGISVYETGLYMRDELEGIKIRELIKMRDERWKRRVPQSVVKYLEEYADKN